MKKRLIYVLTILIIFIINIKVNAAFPSKLEGLMVPPYCNGDACYAGPYNDQNVYKVAVYSAGTLSNLGITSNAFIGTSPTGKDVLTILCTNHRKVTNVKLGNITSCSKITSTSANGYWDDAVKAGVASIYRNLLASTTIRTPIELGENSQTGGCSPYYNAIKTISSFEYSKKVKDISGDVSDCVNKTWLDEANKEYDRVKNMEITITSIETESDASAVYLKVNTETNGGSSSKTFKFYDSNNTEISATLESSGTYNGYYKILRSNFSGNRIKVNVTSKYDTFTVENYDCGNYQQLSPIYYESKQFTKVAEDTIDVPPTNYNLKVQGCLDGYITDGLNINSVLYGSFGAKINNTTPPSGSYSAGNQMYFSGSFPINTKYEFNNIKAKSGYTYAGYSYGDTCYPEESGTNISGTLDKNLTISLAFFSSDTYVITKQKTNGRKIQGAEFEIYEDEYCLYPITTESPLITNAKGEIPITLEPFKTYYFKEVKPASDDYIFYPRQAPCYELSSNPSDNIVENETTCEEEFNADSSVLNRIKIYKNWNLSNEGRFNNLLNFSERYAEYACDGTVPEYYKNKDCLYSEQNVYTEPDFSSGNLSAYNDKVQKNNVDVGYCLTTFETKNRASINENIKAGRLIIGSEQENTRALTGVLTKTCYVYENITSSFNDSRTYRDYISGVKVDGEELKFNITEANKKIYMKYEGTQSNGLKKFVGKVSIDYLFSPVWVKKISGKPCEEADKTSGICTFLGSGIVSKFMDGKEYYGSFGFEVVYGTKSNENPFSDGYLFYEDEEQKSIDYCSYWVEPEIIKYPDPDDPGNLDLEFRSIDTNTPFNRAPNTNWNDGNDNDNNQIINEVIKNRNNSYNKTREGALYTTDPTKKTKKIVLTPEIIQNIRTYNKTHPYDDYLLKCGKDKKGNKVCENSFLKEFNIIKVN